MTRLPFSENKEKRSDLFRGACSPDCQKDCGKEMNMGISVVPDARNGSVPAGTAKKPEIVRESEKAAQKRLPDTFSEMIRDRREEFYVRVREGKSEPSFPIGAGSYTEKEWNKLLKSFDAVQEALREAAGLEADEEKKKSLLAVRGDDTDEDDEDAVNAEMLLAEYTTCTCPAENPEEEDDVYIIVYDVEGIRCLNTTTGMCEWSIRFTDQSQYDGVKKYLSDSAESGDMSFACQEDFWKKFILTQ